MEEKIEMKNEDEAWRIQQDLASLYGKISSMDPKYGSDGAEFKQKYLANELDMENDVKTVLDAIRFTANIWKNFLSAFYTSTQQKEACKTAENVLSFANGYIALFEQQHRDPDFPSMIEGMVQSIEMSFYEEMPFFIDLKGRNERVQWKQSLPMTTCLHRLLGIFIRLHIVGARETIGLEPFYDLLTQEGFVQHMQEALSVVAEHNEVQRSKLLAFAMGTHRRLGSESSIPRILEVADMGHVVASGLKADGVFCKA